MKKAQGLPITTIIIAALALVVLVILFAIFTGRISIFGRGITECPGRCEMPYSETGEQAVTEGRIALDINAKCDPQFEKAITGIYIAPGQPANTPTDKLIYCSKCCVSIV
ncbi:hypothetical protein KY338_01015 [Candidatus Woesearchaeota archaeon]|nr:hypothetical protein [Candidatus Woesearchaeota archaeon]MBW3006178.1 hypothetical protein [Candidatus Woesearchaeota archaeon]